VGALPGPFKINGSPGSSLLVGMAGSRIHQGGYYLR
jgi:hypothetical protein